MTNKIDPEWLEAMQGIAAGKPMSDGDWIDAVCEVIKSYPNPAAYHPTSREGELMCLVMDRLPRPAFMDVVSDSVPQTIDARGDVIDAVPVV